MNKEKLEGIRKDILLASGLSQSTEAVRLLVSIHNRLKEIIDECENVDANWWACATSYRGSGRPNRIWAEQDNEGSPDRCIYPEYANTFAGGRNYPFNGMGGDVLGGPFETEDEAMAFADEMIEQDEQTNMLYWIR